MDKDLLLKDLKYLMDHINYDDADTDFQDGYLLGCHDAYKTILETILTGRYDKKYQN